MVTCRRLHLTIHRSAWQEGRELLIFRQLRLAQATRQATVRQLGRTYLLPRLPDFFSFSNFFRNRSDCMDEQDTGESTNIQETKQQEKASLLHSAAELLIVSITGCAPGKPSGEPQK